MHPRPSADLQSPAVRGEICAMSLKHLVLVALSMSSIGCVMVSEDIGRLRRGDATSRVVRLEEPWRADAVERECGAAKASNETLYLWLDLGRSPHLAALHPEWIGGTGSHEDWRVAFPQAPKAGPGERVGAYPWTPIWYRAVLEHRIAEITTLLEPHASTIAGVFLNQVQGIPSACGCGNDQCRWTVDYRMPGGLEKVDGAPTALLVSALKKRLPSIEWIPVWVTECTEHDQPGKDSTGYCGDVHCFNGLCWKESSKEIGALSDTTTTVALLSSPRFFKRDLPRYGDGGWLAESLRELGEIPPRNGTKGIEAGRVIAVLDGEGLSGPQRSDLERKARALGVGGTIVLDELPAEDWEPRLIPAVAR